MLAPDAFTEWLRRRTFPPPPPEFGPDAPRRVGAEVELLCHATVGGIAPLQAVVLPWIRGHGARHGWLEQRSGKGVPEFRVPGGGRVTFEPGGQLEYAAPPADAPGPLLDDLHAVLGALHRSAGDAGIALRALGIDPDHPVECAPLQLRAPRYAEMDRYFATIGPFGARMMRQTASVQLSLDAAAGGLRTWRLLNAAAAPITALFADSRRYAGVDSGHASFRAHCWRRLDPLRTGLLPAEPCGDPAAEYAAFARAAPVLRPGPDGEYVPLGCLLDAGTIDEAAAETHISTLFPEIRPRGHLELRSLDAVPADGLAAAVLLPDALLADAAAIGEASEAAGDPDPDLLVAAGRAGLADPRVAGRAAALLDVARAAWRRHPERYRGADVERAETWLAGRR